VERVSTAVTPLKAAEASMMSSSELFDFDASTAGEGDEGFRSSVENGAVTGDAASSTSRRATTRTQDRSWDRSMPGVAESTMSASRRFAPRDEKHQVSRARDGGVLIR
jgi:hypothetical protein